MKVIHALLVSALIPINASALHGQFKSVQLAGMASLGQTTGLLGCESCSAGSATNFAVDLVVLDKVGIGVRTLRWNSDPGVQVMSFDMVGFDWFPAGRDRRIIPFVTGGFGRASTEFRVPQGLHAESVDSASNVYGLSGGVGLDVRVVSRLAITPSLTIYHTAIGGTHRDCTQRNYTLGDFSWYCGKSSAFDGVSFVSFALGIGWR